MSDSSDSYYDTLQDARNFSTAHAALVIVILIPAVVFFFLSLCLSHRRKDPARGFITWFKITLAVFVLYCLFSTIACGLIAADYWLSYYGYYFSNLLDFYRAEVHINNLSGFFETYTEILVFVTLICLYVGINTVRTGEAGKVNGIIKYVAYGFAALLAVLEIASWAIRTKLYVDQYSEAYLTTGGGDFDLGLWNSGRRLSFAIVVILWAISLSVFSLSISGLIQSRPDPRVKKASVYLLVCSILYLMRTTYDLAYYIKYINLTDGAGYDPPYDWYMEVLSPIFSLWPTFVILVLLFALGVKKSQGLWSMEQGYSTGGQNYGNNWNQPAQGWQQPPQGMQQQQGGYYPPQQPHYQQQPYQPQYQQQAPPAPY